MNNYPLIFGVFCVTATLATVLLRPDARVRFEAEVMHQEPEQALELLNRFADTKVYHDTLKLTHARLALGAGDLEGARGSFSELLDPEMPSPTILDYLAEIALLENDLGDAARLARQAQNIRPSEERRLRLGYWYRVLKDPEAEIAVLRQGAPEALTAWEVGRLGRLLGQAGDAAAYEGLLTTLSGSKREDAQAFQRQLIDYQIETGQFDAAAQTAFDAFGARDQDIAMVEFTLGGLIQKGAIDPAQSLATRVLHGDPGVGHILVMPFIRAGHGGIARFLQDSWLAEADTLTRDQWNALAGFAEITGDLSGLRMALAREADVAGDAVPGTVFLQFVRYGGARSLVPFRRYLTPEILEASPLVAAAWSGWTNDPAATYRHLVRASHLDLSDWDRSIWMSIAEGLRGTAYFSQLLAGAPADPQLRTLLRGTVITEGASAPDG